MNHIQALSMQVRDIRSQQSLTQAELAELAGVSLRALITIESGTGNPRLSTLSQICTALGHQLTIQPSQSNVNN